MRWTLFEWPTAATWCSARAVTSSRNQVSPRLPDLTSHLSPRGSRPAPVTRTRLPLDTGGMIGVRRIAAETT